jgi:acetyl-CoA carboxylase carboxyltransferase component
MVEGGGLGRFEPEAIGPAAMQAGIGGVEVLVDDEAQGVRVARRALGLLLGKAASVAEGTAAALQTPLRHAVPENRLRAYEVRPILTTIFDTGSLLELQPQHGRAVITALARIEGRAVAVLASNPQHGAAAIDAEAARKAAGLIRKASTRGLPVLSFIDTPGFMVGPEAEAAGQVRASGELFIAAAQCNVPWLAVVLRRGYGLGAMALAGGSLQVPFATASWPTGEFGAMGLEGAVRLGYRKELAAAGSDAQREQLFQALLAEQVERGQALNMAAMLEIDAVIDPAETRAWLAKGLDAACARK